MWIFAWRNLLTRPLRTTLALVGLSIPILGVLGLFSLSSGLRNLVGDTLSKIQGVMVLRENAPSPVFSDLEADLADQLRQTPGVRVVAPEVWGVAPPVEGSNLISKTVGMLRAQSREQRLQSLFDAIVIQGQDIPAHSNLKSAVFPKALLPQSEGGGRFLNLSDRGTRNIVISKKIAEDFKDPRTGRPKRVGDTLKIGDDPFPIVGIYSTGSMFLDVVIIMDIDTARAVLKKTPKTVSSYYVEAKDPGRIDEVAEQIEAKFPGVDARSMSEFMENFGRLMGQLDTFLLMTVSLALLVGVVGIINTMLMSTTERYGEFGVLRTNGWSQLNVLTLVTAESAYLGLLAGILGCLLAAIGTAIANQFISGGLKLLITPWLVALGLGLSIVMGMIGGLFPAWRAAQLVPMEAIRRGAR
ncbi:MAG: ABC transporter permease [Isosphaeraceae bacterium]|nr:ABC transporter permease [Isosphaeraceae bacterium]